MTLTLLAACALTTACDDDQCEWGGQLDRASAPEPPQQRDPYTGQCTSYYVPPPCDCVDPCAESCICPADTRAAPVPFVEPTTYGYCNVGCEGLSESACLDTAACRAVYRSTCGPGVQCDDRVYLDCWSTDQNGPIQGGSCQGLDAQTCSQHNDCIAVHDSIWANNLPQPGHGGFLSCHDEPVTTAEPGLCFAEPTCVTAPPNCPEATFPGVKDGCYSGYCIPLAECEAPPACADIADEALCIAVGSCSPLYEGQNCTCTPTSCTCASWLYTSCSAP